MAKEHMAFHMCMWSCWQYPPGQTPWCLGLYRDTICEEGAAVPSSNPLINPHTRENVYVFSGYAGTCVPFQFIPDIMCLAFSHFTTSPLSMLLAPDSRPNMLAVMMGRRAKCIDGISPTIYYYKNSHSHINKSHDWLVQPTPTVPSRPSTPFHYL